MNHFFSLEVVVFELAHVAGDPVLAQSYELVVVLQLKSQGEEGQQEVEVNKVGIEIQLRSNVG